MKIALIVLGLAFHLTSLADDRFPIGPDSKLTPGSLCARGNSHRYPENIPYCNRSVSSGRKKDIIHDYDAILGYHVSEMNRQLFKIDHYIPLCMGGSNETSNLWPQHESVYNITDPLEGAACIKMAEGRLLQRDAVQLIREGKADLKKARSILEYIQNL